ncbi:hypothetical protein OPT61_g372 [Boeremia exigua]|uniref:Uncharacterized protein n=1 Tax=Boeremia exigua TaxID=749465 RepID=A0ACC2IU34_9PLEO|nr:hypothetical protein OPT61_g372 [Boeremia exigua]
MYTGFRTVIAHFGPEKYAGFRVRRADWRGVSGDDGAIGGAWLKVAMGLRKRQISTMGSTHEADCGEADGAVLEVLSCRKLWNTHSVTQRTLYSPVLARAPHIQVTRTLFSTAGDNTLKDGLLISRGGKNTAISLIAVVCVVKDHSEGLPRDCPRPSFVIAAEAVIPAIRANRCIGTVGGKSRERQVQCLKLQVMARMRSGGHRCNSRGSSSLWNIDHDVGGTTGSQVARLRLARVQHESGIPRALQDFTQDDVLSRAEESSRIQHEIILATHEDLLDRHFRSCGVDFGEAGQSAGPRAIVIVFEGVAKAATVPAEKSGGQTSSHQMITVHGYQDSLLKCLTAVPVSAVMGRHANPDIRRAFVEFQDTDTPSKCNKVRCQHCGFVRAKNTTRQIEHLQECQAYLNSPDAQAHIAATQASQSIVEATIPQGPSAILNGQQPNPNLQVNRRGPNTKRTRDGQPIAPNPVQQHPAPSLTNHLLSVCSRPFAQATQQPFLSHAGCGSLAAGPLSQWLVQDGHYSRGYIRFVGQLLAKIRLPQTQNSQFHPMYRTMDLLISALNNMRREMQFFEITATKYGLALSNEPPSPITRSLLDLFVSASSSSASLLEGMVVLWGTEHCYRSAWQYAASFSTSLSTPSNENHIVALHQALIPNWTSPAFNKFVDATRALVDELANTTTARDGKEEMQRCDEIFRQICWLEQRFWPEVDGMGEDNDGAQLSGRAHMGPMSDNAISNSHMNNQNINNGPVSRGRINSNAINHTNINGPMGSQMNRQSMAGSMMGGQDMSGQGMNGSATSGDDGTPGNDDGRPNSVFLNSALEGQGP